VNTVVSSAMVMEINFFNSFVLNVDLLDVTPFGRKFTWHHSNGLAMSRIDMALFRKGGIDIGGVPHFGCSREQFRIIVP